MRWTLNLMGEGLDFMGFGRCHGEWKLDVMRWTLNVMGRGPGFHGDWKVGVMGSASWM
jgi:hypothetical protein